MKSLIIIFTLATLILPTTLKADDIADLESRLGEGKIDPSQPSPYFLYSELHEMDIKTLEQFRTDLAKRKDDPAIKGSPSEELLRKILERLILLLKFREPAMAGLLNGEIYQLMEMINLGIRNKKDPLSEFILNELNKKLSLIIHSITAKTNTITFLFAPDNSALQSIKTNPLMGKIIIDDFIEDQLFSLKLTFEECTRRSTPLFAIKHTIINLIGSTNPWESPVVNWHQPVIDFRLLLNSNQLFLDPHSNEWIFFDAKSDKFFEHTDIDGNIVNDREMVHDLFSSFKMDMDFREKGFNSWTRTIPTIITHNESFYIEMDKNKTLTISELWGIQFTERVRDVDIPRARIWPLCGT